jgi:hypothetical protein
MPIACIHLEGNGILLKAHGVLTAHDVREANAQIYSSPEAIRKISYQISDYTGVTEIRMSSSEVEALAQEDSRAAAIHPNMLLAVVADKDIVFGLLRMWHISVETEAQNIHVFRTLPEAEAWIRTRLRAL